MTKPALYTDQLSLYAGDSLALHISADASPCTLTVTRLGLENTTVLQIDAMDCQAHPIPENVVQIGCGWPQHSSIEIPSNCESGYYELTLTDAEGDTCHHFVVVKAAKPVSKTALVLATNTYQAYNYWGGQNSYAGVGAMMRGEVDMATALTRAVGRLSLQRPFAEYIVHAPEYVPRLVNLKKREFEQAPFGVDPSMATQTEFGPFDPAAGFVNKWEHKFVLWAEARNIAFDYFIDTDLNEMGALDGYDTLIVVGHNEYWASEQRDTVDSFVEAGGNLCVFSGNTSYWKVRWEDDGKTMIAHKASAEKNDPLWQDESTRAQSSGLWSHKAFNRTEAQTIGLSFLYGGYHRLGNCAARGQAGYTVYDEDHWALEGTDLFYGDVFGDEVILVGYENDGCPLHFDEFNRLKVKSGKGFPENLEVIAMAPVVLCESPHDGYDPIIPPEELDRIANIKYDKVTNKTINDSRFGHAVMAGFSKSNGYVFNAGTTEWVHALSEGNIFAEKITQNIFKRFNII